jgi:hypothetical protein
MVTQTVVCKDITRGSLKPLPQCFVCLTDVPADEDECRFKGTSRDVVSTLASLVELQVDTGYRTIIRKGRAKPSKISFNFPPGLDPLFPVVFNRMITPEVIKAKMVRHRLAKVYLAVKISDELGLVNSDSLRACLISSPTERAFACRTAERSPPQQRADTSGYVR